MGIFESFVVMFEADASSLNKGIDDSSQKTKKLTDHLNVTDKAAQNVGSSISNLLATAGGALTAILSVSAITQGINASADYADHLGEVSDMLGVNIEMLDAWRRVTQLSGGTAEGFDMSLQTLSADFAMIATKGTSRTLPFFKELGIKLKDAHGNMREVMDVLPELADKFEKMSKQESLGMGRKLGLDEGTIMMLQRGRREIDEMVKKQKELGLVTKEQAELAGDFNDSLDIMNMSFRGLFLSMGQSIIPAFKWIAEAITNLVAFFRKHSDFMTGLFIALGTAIMVFLVPPLITAGAAALAAFAPFLIMGAIVTVVAGAFALLYDDVMMFLDGHDSMIGRIAQDYPWFGDMIHSIIDAFKYLGKIGVEIFGLIGDLFKLGGRGVSAFFGKIEEGIDWAKGAFPEFFALIEKIGEIFGMVWDGVWDAFVATFNGIVGEFKNIGKAMGIDLSIEGVKNARSMAQNTLATANTHPLNSVTSGAIANSKTSNVSSNVTVGKVEVHTKATDADGISRAISGSLKAEVKKATSQHDDGVRI